MLLQAALNGPFTKDDHPAMPITAAELAPTRRRACRPAPGRSTCTRATATAGRRFDPAVIDAAVREVRAACGGPVGVSTGAWIEPDRG